jgi:hypothetical protein
MSSLSHATTGLKGETPSTSNTAVSGNSSSTEKSTREPPTTPEASPNENKQPKMGILPSKPGGEAEKAAEKLFEERMEGEYAKREGGA